MRHRHATPTVMSQPCFHSGPAGSLISRGRARTQRAPIKILGSVVYLASIYQPCSMAPSMVSRWYQSCIDRKRNGQRASDQQIPTVH